MKPWSPLARRVLASAFGVLLLARPLAAQDVDRVLDEVTALFGRNEYAKAIELMQSIPEDVAPKPHIRKHLGIAQALMNLGRFAEAPPHIAEARAIAQANRDAAGEANVELAQGNYQQWQRQHAAALASFERAVNLARQAGDRSALANAYLRLAQAYQDLQDWSRSLHYVDLSFEARTEPTLLHRFNHAVGRGIAHFELYERDAAEADFHEALKLAIASGGKRNQSFALGELGYLHWTFDKDTTRALDYYGRAIELAVEAKTPDLESSWRVNRGSVYRDIGRYEEALAEYRRVLDDEKRLGVPHPHFAATKNIGQSYRLMRRFEDALGVLEPLVARDAARAAPRHLWQARMELASTYEALGQMDKAAGQYRAMLDVIEEHRNSAILDAFRTGTFAHTLAAYDPYERYMRFLLRDGETADAIAESFRLSERARARGFLEMLASVRSAIATTVPPALLEEERRITQSISSVQAQLRNAALTRSERDSLLAELTRREQARDRFRLRLRVEHPSLAETRYPDVAGPRELQTTLAAGETVISFFLGESDSFRWTIARDRITFHRLPARATIERQAERVRNQLRAPGDVNVVRKDAQALASLLLADLTLGTGALVVIPHGVLHYVPFEILPHQGDLLIQRHAVSYAPSLNALAFLRRQPVNSAPLRVLAVGAPEIDTTLSQSPARGGEVDAVSLLGPLPFADDELEAIRRALPGVTETLSGSAARETALRRPDLNAFRVVHFATHGLVSEAHPSRSALLLSPEEREDGLLQTGDIYRLGLNSDLVVLSACQTALGREITGEGILGLTRAFFHGGSRAVIAALWNLNDRFAAALVERLYAEIAAGRSSEDALRAAKLSFVNDPQYAHPFYWSSLVLAGDGTRVLQPEATPSRVLPWAVAVAVALVAAWLLIARRRLPVVPTV